MIIISNNNKSSRHLTKYHPRTKPIMYTQTREHICTPQQAHACHCSSWFSNTDDHFRYYFLFSRPGCCPSLPRQLMFRRWGIITLTIWQLKLSPPVQQCQSTAGTSPDNKSDLCKLSANELNTFFVVLCNYLIV